MEPEPLISLLSIDLYAALQFLVLFVLLMSSAMISGAEVAFFSLQKIDLNLLEKNGFKFFDRLSSMLQSPKKLLATILIANNFINILIVLIFASVGASLFEGITYFFDLFFFKLSLRFLVEVVLITFLILLFGEVLPKVYANRNAVRFSKFMTQPLFVLQYVLNPLSYLLINLTGFVEKKLEVKSSDLSVEKLSQALELTSENATTIEEKNILEGIVTFGNTETAQVMRPRIDICAISNEISFQEVLNVILSKGFSRIPVYKGHIDEVIGVLYTKDMLPHLQKKNFDWSKHLRLPFFVPENKKLDDLLSDFKEKKNHLAIVVDEYGGTSGVVTLEDVIEEIVGDINDEFDSDDLHYSKLDDKNYIFDGKTTLKDFYKITNTDPELFESEKGESETIAGFLLEVSGRFMKKDEKMQFKNYLFTIESVDQKRIKQIKVTLS